MGFLELSGASVLLLLRNGIANDWKSLCKAVGIDPSESRTAQSELRHKLYNLHDSGLIDFQIKPGRLREPIEGKITLTENWSKLQEAIGVSLSSIADLKSVGYLLVAPFFGAPKEPETKTDVFVLMPFTAKLKPVYEDHITAVCKRLDLAVGRADDFFSVNAVMGNIWRSINVARIIIADCTGRNPNVFYEIGIAHAIGKPVILITQNRHDAPFDIRYIYNIEYEFVPRGMRKFEERLTEAIQIALKANRGEPLVKPWEQ